MGSFLPMEEAVAGNASGEESLSQWLAELPQMVTGLHSTDSGVQLEAIMKFRKLLSIDDRPIKEVIETGVVPIFVEFLQREDFPPLQFEAAWALTNIATGTSDDIEVIIQSGAVPFLCRLLQSDIDDVSEQAIWALGNISGESPQCRDVVLQCGAMDLLLTQVAKNPKITVLRVATWTLSNLFRGKPRPQNDMITLALPTLVKLLNVDDEEVLTDACWIFTYLLNSPHEQIKTIIESGACRRLVELLLYPSPAAQTPALRSIGYIAMGNDWQTQVLVHLDALPILHTLLKHSDESIVKESCLALSNIIVTNQKMLQLAIDANILTTLIELLSTVDFEIRKEAVYAVVGATSSGSWSQIMHLVQLGCIGALCDFLTAEDTKVVLRTLEGLENILRVSKQVGTNENNDVVMLIKEAGGLNKIQALQYHAHEDVIAQSVKIVKQYFQTDAVAHQSPASAQTSGQ